MRDGGRFPSCDDPQPDDDPILDARSTRSEERARLMRRIAEAVDLPVAAFLDGQPQPPSQHGPSASECAAMLAAFVRITDPAVRRDCVEMLERRADA